MSRRPTTSGRVEGRTVPRPNASDIKQPHVPAVNAPRLWTFSFRFFRQIENFGLSASEPSWFVSLLDRFQALCEYEIDAFRSDGRAKGNWRYHEIDWGMKNVPITRAQLEWLPPSYRDNPEEFPIVQFMVSRALGRVIGFWDEHDVFNVVLLDPLHNMQPSKSYSYKVNPCSPLSCMYSSLFNAVDVAKQAECLNSGCPSRVAIQQVETSRIGFNAILVALDDTQLQDAQDVCSTYGKSHVEIYVAGIYATMEQDDRNQNSSTDEH